MFAGYDDNDEDDSLMNFIKSEAKTLVDSVLEDSVVVLHDSSALNTSSSIQVENNLSENDEQPLSHEISIEDSSIGQLNAQLPLNHYSNNPSADHVHNSDELSDNFAIKSDYDLIAKSPTIESGMSGKDFEDVDDEYNLSISNMNESCVVKVENVTNLDLDFPISVHESVAGGFKASEGEETIKDEEIIIDSIQNDTATCFANKETSIRSSGNKTSEIFEAKGDNYRHEHNK